MNNERDAHNALIETAQAASTDAIRDEADPLENTVVLPVTDRRYRSREARVMVFDEMPTRFRDFRDGQREHAMTAHEINQQDGFSGDEKL